MHTRRNALLVFAVLLLLTFVTYGRVLPYSFMYDDPLEMGRGAGRSVFDILVSSNGYAYYRPLTFILWQAVYAIFHRYDLVLCHALSLVVHAVNGLLVYILASKLMRRPAAAVAAGLFVLFPLNYQVVQWIAALSHELATLFILVTLLSYEAHRRKGGAAWLAVSIVSAVLAFLSHESGILVGPLVLLWEGWLRREAEGSRHRALPFLYLGLSGLFVVIWLLIPKQGGSLALTPDSVPANALYFLEGFGYPVAALAARLSRALGSGVSPYLLAGLSASAALVLLLAAYRAGRQLPLLLFALLWFAFAAAIVVPTRSFVYVMNGPRLLYLASVGIAIAWAGLLGLAWSKSSGARLGQAAVVVTLALVMVWSYRFVSLRNDMYRVGSAAVFELSELSRPFVNRGALVAVNVPGWLALPQPSFPLGNTGVTMIPDYVGLDAVTAVHTGMGVRMESLTFPDLLQKGSYTIGPHGQATSLERLDETFRKATGVVLATGNEDISVRFVGRLQGGQTDEPKAPLAAWDGRLLLQRADWDVTENVLRLDLRWQCRQPASADLTVFVQLLDEQGKVVAAADGYPVGRMSAIRLWRAGDLADDVRYLQLPAVRGAAGYRIALGLYDAGTGQRAQGTDAGGQPLADNAYVFALTR